MTDIYLTTKYDDKLSALDIYKKYPDLLPAIGCDFPDSNHKVLIIGESHYLPEKSKIHLDLESWYDGNKRLLNDEEKKWINTRENLWAGLRKMDANRGYTIYSNLAGAVREVNSDHENKESTFRKLAFMNYFLRPAEAGKSIKRVERDKEMAFENLENVIEKCGVTHLIFVSRIAFWDFDWYNRKVREVIPKESVFTVPHPACSWWNRKSKNYKSENGEALTGKEKFKWLIAKYGLT